MKYGVAYPGDDAHILIPAGYVQARCYFHPPGGWIWIWDRPPATTPVCPLCKSTPIKD